MSGSGAGIPSAAPRLLMPNIKCYTLISRRFSQRVNSARLTMLHPNRSYLCNVDGGDYNGIVLPTPKRRKIWTVEGTSLVNLNVADELNTEDPISTGTSLIDSDETTDDYRASTHPSSGAQGTSNGISARCSPARATEAGDGARSRGKPQKICFGMVRYYR